MRYTRLVIKSLADKQTEALLASTRVSYLQAQTDVTNGRTTLVWATAAAVLLSLGLVGYLDVRYDTLKPPTPDLLAAAGSRKERLTAVALFGWNPLVVFETGQGHNDILIASILLDRRPTRTKPSRYPSVSILIAAYNEEASIADTLRSIANGVVVLTFRDVVSMDPTQRDLGSQKIGTETVRAAEVLVRVGVHEGEVVVHGARVEGRARRVDEHGRIMWQAREKKRQSDGRHVIARKKRLARPWDN